MHHTSSIIEDQLPLESIDQLGSKLSIYWCHSVDSILKNNYSRNSDYLQSKLNKRSDRHSNKKKICSSQLHIHICEYHNSRYSSRGNCHNSQRSKGMLNLVLCQCNFGSKYYNSCKFGSEESRGSRQTHFHTFQVHNQSCRGECNC